jgi:hypothetical protein
LCSTWTGKIHHYKTQLISKQSKMKSWHAFSCSCWALSLSLSFTSSHQFQQYWSNSWSVSIVIHHPPQGLCMCC